MSPCPIHYPIEHMIAELAADPVAAWVRGFLAGCESGHADGYAAGVDDTLSSWTEMVRRMNRESERAGRRKQWRAAVLRGENPAHATGPESGREVDHGGN